MAAKDPSTRIKTALRAHQQATDPIDKLQASRRIREAAEELEAMAIADARQSGATWTEIGSCYGLTKQGAQQRFRTTTKQASGPSSKTVARGRSAQS